MRLDIPFIPVLHFRRGSVAQKGNPAPPEIDQVRGRPRPAAQVVGADRAILLARQVRPPDDEPALCFRKGVEPLMQQTLTKEDDSVRMVRSHQFGEVVHIPRREMRDQQVAPRYPRRLGNAADEILHERMQRLALPGMRIGNDHRNRRRRAGEEGGHRRPEMVVLLARNLPDAALGFIVDGRAVVERARHRRDRDARDGGEVLKARSAGHFRQTPAYA